MESKLYLVQEGRFRKPRRSEEIHNTFQDNNCWLGSCVRVERTEGQETTEQAGSPAIIWLEFMA